MMESEIDIVWGFFHKAGAGATKLVGERYLPSTNMDEMHRAFSCGNLGESVNASVLVHPLASFKRREATNASGSLSVLRQWITLLLGQMET
jgi:hypothetical protein